MNNFFKTLFPLSLSILLINCGGGGSTSADDNSTTTTTVPSVYLSGGNSPTTTFHAIYNKDGVSTQLNPDILAAATGIFVTDSNIYMSGIYRESGSIDMPCYWEGTTKIDLDVAGSSEGFATGIYVAGSDVYVSGYYILGAAFKACYWKNGTLNDLGGGWGTSIFVSGSDVYVAGTDNSGKPVYWKNGVPTSLSANTGGGHSIQVIDGVVYIAGQETVGADVRAVFWQDGVATYLSDAGTDGLASSIYVSGSDVYVMGLYQDYTKLAYWKNGVSGKVDMDTGSYSPTKPSADIFWRLPRIFVNGSDVYVVDPLGDGTDITAGGYWKNGVLSTPTEEIYTNVFVK